ncbi:MAG: Methylase involved in ubiquinone/menaquinone biosynthesis [Promethearchaeota archaeon]|nr:MAG: Methylase involved in ubiquinone/menaquinone biosynthesis [Candidatus Lokiarchaeota archaeon]
MKRWLNFPGKKVLKRIGIKKGDWVLDFGCGNGTYSIYAAIVVGHEGKIFALDKRSDRIDELKEKLGYLKSIHNIEFIITEGEVGLPLDDKILDVILLFDVYHLIDDSRKEKLLQECKRLLKEDGFLSWYPAHLEEDDIDLDKIDKEFNKVGFILKEKFQMEMVHWGKMEIGTILNYNLQ